MAMLHVFHLEALIFWNGLIDISSLLACTIIEIHSSLLI